MRPPTTSTPPVWIVAVLVTVWSAALWQVACADPASARTSSPIPWERPAWGSGEIHGDGLDTRAEILAKRCVVRAWAPNRRTVLVAVCKDAYSGERELRLGTGWQIDHEYPAATAWRSRVWRDRQGRPCSRAKHAAACSEFVRFFNDVDNLAITTAESNRQKSDRGPGDWCPTLRGSRIALATRMLRTVNRWSLPLSHSDRSGLVAWSRGECLPRAAVIGTAAQ
jgi:hypothetical protein